MINMQSIDGQRHMSDLTESLIGNENSMNDSGANDGVSRLRVSNAADGVPTMIVSEGRGMDNMASGNMSETDISQTPRMVRRQRSLSMTAQRYKERRAALFLTSLEHLPTRGLNKKVVGTPKNVEVDFETRDMKAEDRLELAALWFKDALHFRTTFYMVTKERRMAHRLLHQRVSRFIRKLNIFVHLMLAVFEYPTDVPLDYGVCPSIELVCCFGYFIELVLHYKIRGGAQFRKNPWLVAKCVILVITLTDVMVFGYGDLWPYRPLRLLRAFYLVENSRDLRLNVAYFWRIMPNLLSVLGLLVLIMIVYTIVGILIFGSWTPCNKNLPVNERLPGCIAYPDYFESFFEGFMRLFELLTTVNFPDVMLPAYKRSPWYAIYFISFLLIGLYFLMNVVLAVVLYSYRRFLKVDYESKMIKQRLALRAVFRLVCARKKSQEMDHETFTGLLMAVYPKRSESDALTIFEVLDEDHSGKLQFEEFVNISATLSHYLRYQAHQERRERMRFTAFESLAHSRLQVRRFIRHKYFRIFINVAIVANCISVLIEAAKVSEGQFDNRFKILDVGFCVLFLCEIVLSLYGYGLDRYWQVYWNRFDLIVVGVGVVATIITYPDMKGALLYRSLIMLRVISRVSFFQELLDLVGRLLDPFAINFGTLFALYYVFAIVGMWLFAHRLPASRNGPPPSDLKYTLYEEAINYEEVRFDSFGRTFTILFSLMVVNNWHVIFSGVLAVTSQWCALYFIAFYILCVAVIVNVIVAFFLEIFTSRYEGGEIDHETVASITEWKIMNQERANKVIREHFKRQHSTVSVSHE